MKCPGNRRATGEVNDSYEAPFVFTNDFAALQENVPDGPLADAQRDLTPEQAASRLRDAGEVHYRDR